MFYGNKYSIDKNHDKKCKQKYCKKYYIHGNKQMISIVATNSPSNTFILLSSRTYKPTKLVYYYFFSTLNDVKDNKCQFD